MTSRLAVMAAGLSALAVSACDELPEWQDPSQGAVAACEEIVKAQLMSPSSYKRVRATYSPGVAMTLEYYKMSQDKRYNPNCPDGFCEEAQRFGMYGGAQIDLQSQGMKRPTRKQIESHIQKLYEQGFARLQNRPADQQKIAFAQIEFDAQNQYGAMIRGMHNCMFAPKTGEKYEPTDAFGTSEEANLSWIAAGSLGNVDVK